MKILALDTSTPIAGVAIVDREKTIAESNLGSGRTHSTTLLPEVGRLLGETGLKPQDLTLVAVGLGPGSFTGLRIGLAAAKGLAWAAQKPLVGVPTLDAMARSHPAGPGRICPLVDARKNQVYAALYHRSSADAWERAADFQAYTIDELVASIQAETVFFGPGLIKYGEVLERDLGKFFNRAGSELDTPKASAVAELAADLFSGGAETDPGRVVPIYVRPPDIREPKTSGLEII